MNALESNHNNTETPVVEQSNQFTKMLSTKAESCELGTSTYASHLMLPYRLLEETKGSVDGKIAKAKKERPHRGEALVRI